MVVLEDDVQLPPWSKYLLISIGLATASLAATVMVGWFIENTALVMAHPRFFPMSFNTAVMMLLCSLSLTCLIMKSKKCFFFFVTSLLLLAGATLLQVILGTDFGIDSLFYKTRIAFSIPYPSRPATNTVVCFLALGISFICFYGHHRAPYLLWLAGLLTATSLAMSFVAFYGYIGHLEGASSTFDFTRMALHTSIGILLLSCAALMSIYFYFSLYPRQSIYFFPVMAFTCGLIIAVALYGSWKKQFESNIKDLRNIGTVEVMKLLKERLSNNFKAVSRFRDRLQASEADQEKLLNLDISNYLKDLQGLHGIVFYDQSGKMVDSRFVDRVDGEDRRHLSAPISVDREISPGFTIFTPHDNKCYLVIEMPYQPVEGKGGFIRFFYVAEELLQAYLIDEKQMILAQVDILIDGELKFSYPEGGAAPGTPFSSLEEFYKGITITASVASSPEFLESLTGTLPQLVLTTGSLSAIVGGFLLFLLQKFKLLSIDLERANNTKSMFLANVSHEIRTPLHGIIGSGSLMETTSLDQKQSKYLKVMMLSANHLLDLVNNLLDITKIESGSLELISEPCNLQELCEEQVQILSSKAKEKNIDLQFHYATERPGLIVVPIRPLKQLIINLLGNAIKFTERGSVSFDVSLKSIGGQSGEIFLKVADTGIGIPQDKQHLLFSKFSQIQESSTIEKKGTGLGLFLSKSLVEKMDGKIWFESVYDKGSTFYTTIPIDFFREGKDHDGK